MGLTQIQVGGATPQTVDYGYDWNSRRVRKVVSGVV
jgi:hypothetical protein